MRIPQENDKTVSFFSRAQFSLLLIPVSLISLRSVAQCPPNLDFETGTFDNWTCYTGNVSASGGRNTIFLANSGGPMPTQHTMYSAPNAEVDYFGGFPVVCPNGSGHSIRLGNNTGGGQAEGISYEFTIPAGRDVYSLIYHYAVVFQDPHHEIFQQPRLEIEVLNVTDNTVLHCSSFTFVPFGNVLPGFFVSPFQQDTTSVWCKDWSAVSINLDNNAGKTIRLFFKTGDCTFTRHFGYAYIDVNSECSSEFVGATYCPDDAFINVTAPYGYQQYTWYNSNFTQTLGVSQNIMFNPPPPVGTTIAVEVVPYNGYGCLDTLYAQLIDTLTVTSYAGGDTLSCNRSLVPLGAIPKPGLTYSWTPTAGLTDPNIANPRAGPAVTTTYILTTSSVGGGCPDTDTVVVRASIIDTSINVVGKLAYCINSGDSTVLYVQPTTRIQWLKDGLPISGQTTTRYRANQSGTYQAILYNSDGCVATTEEKTVSIETPQPGIRYPIEYAVSGHPQQLKARTFGVDVEWSPPTFLNSTSTVTPVFNGTTDNLYTIAIETAAGCLTVDTQLVKVFKEVKFYVPTGFTPNQDGLNDYLKPIPVGIKEMKYFRIYNRWGQLVFDIKQDPRGWNGMIGGKLQSSQVVVWMAEGIGINDRTYKQKGTCVLIR
ncbi:MAG TPA: T9SS type B sorting domain-containing protein [Chitinophagaceae bacterium]|nr:T9SS type B sorting domain-containing protein [Chitinophagaceae bacterium]